jgi:hypothetical protein
VAGLDRGAALAMTGIWGGLVTNVERARSQSPKVFWLVGIPPPNDILINDSIGLIVLMLVLWFGVVRTRFPGPPVTREAIAARAAEIAAEERAVLQGAD